MRFDVLKFLLAKTCSRRTLRIFATSLGVEIAWRWKDLLDRKFYSCDFSTHFSSFGQSPTLTLWNDILNWRIQIKKLSAEGIRPQTPQLQVASHCSFRRISGPSDVKKLSFCYLTKSYDSLEHLSVISFGIRSAFPFVSDQERAMGDLSVQQV